MKNPFDPREIADLVAKQIEAIEHAHIPMTPDLRRMLVSSAILSRRLAALINGREMER